MGCGGMRYGWLWFGSSGKVRRVMAGYDWVWYGTVRSGSMRYGQVRLVR